MVSRVFLRKSGAVWLDLPAGNRFRDLISARAAVNLKESVQAF
jgi:hypothetical protein